MAAGKINRSSVSGRFVTKAYASTHKRTTEIQKIKHRR